MSGITSYKAHQITLSQVKYCCTTSTRYTSQHFKLAISTANYVFQVSCLKSVKTIKHGGKNNDNKNYT